MDGGGTGTLAVVARSGGAIAGQGRAGASSVYSVSRTAALEATRSAVQAACREARVEASEIRAACFGFAGAGREEDRAIYEDIVGSLGLSTRPEVASDVEIALDAATFGVDGAILVSGTGSVCMGRAGSLVVRVGGQGPVLGDEGSGYDIGRKAIIACLKAAEGRGAPTLLSDVVPAFLGIPCIQDAPTLFRLGGERGRVAELGFRVLEAAYFDCDPVAMAITREAASELVQLVGAVFGQLGCTVPVWLSGGVFAASQEYAQDVVREAGLRYRGLYVAFLETAPVAGAVWRAFRQVGEEIISEEDLKQLLETKKNPVAYDGFEPSGKIHIAQAVLRAINVNKVTSTGTKFKMLVADWHAWANKKMGGDLEKIQTVGKYFIEVWKACGMDLDNVEFVWVSDMVKDEAYWRKVMQVAINSTLNRIIRCGQIMGKRRGPAGITDTVPLHAVRRHIPPWH